MWNVSRLNSTRGTWWWACLRQMHLNGEPSLSCAMSTTFQLAQRQFTIWPLPFITRTVLTSKTNMLVFCMSNTTMRSLLKAGLHYHLSYIKKSNILAQSHPVCLCSLFCTNNYDKTVTCNMHCVKIFWSLEIALSCPGV